MAKDTLRLNVENLSESVTEKSRKADGVFISRRVYSGSERPNRCDRIAMQVINPVCQWSQCRDETQLQGSSVKSH